MNDEELEQYISQFAPFKDRAEFTSEAPEDYVKRMQPLLPHWPEEVLVEWLYRHAGGCLADYAPLRFERFHFSLEEWPVEDIPGPEAFANPRMCENFSDIERRAAGPHDWLAKYMLEHGTWNTPIVLLDNHDGGACEQTWGIIRTPWHLMEGHRRLSFLNGLRERGKAIDGHAVYVVTLQDA
ncbi:hypothetical protein [Halomonas sp. ND22Bw]|uniref:hypothetical protein n=1 Tax=Halomonas sp. ND22Bw TaxID=2054178 RepID=UPI0011B1C6B9